MTVAEIAALGLGLIAIVAPFMWREMPTFVSYPIAGIGLLLLGYAGIRIIEDFISTKFHAGPLILVFVGLLVISAGVFWQIHAPVQSPAAVSHPAPQHGPEAPSINSSPIPAKLPANKLGDILMV